MTRVDFRKAFGGEALRRAQSPTAPSKVADPAIAGPASPPLWRRILRAPFSLVRRFLVGHLITTTDEINMHVARTRQSVIALEDRLQGLESVLISNIQGLESLLVNRLHQLDIKVRGPHEYDTNTAAIRLNDGYVLVPKRARKLRLLLADAPPDGLEPGTSQVIRRLLSKGMTAVDIGANVGALSLVCARAVGPSGKVYAFEPDPEFADLLPETFDLNGTDWVEVHRTAIGRANDQTTFHISPIGGHSSIYPLPSSEAAQQLDIQVQVRRLDDVIGSDTKVDLVKMDVEGAELDVLIGMPRLIKQNPDLSIVAEYGRSHLSRQGLDPAFWADQFLSKGYSLFAIDEMSGRCEPTSAAAFGERESVNIAMARFGTRAYDVLSGSK